MEQKNQKAWNGEENANVEFFRLNMIDKCNCNMGSVDIADQLRNNHRFDVWIRQTKWWRSILFWSYGVEIVNAFTAMKRYLEDNGVSKKEIMGQHDFRKEHALDLLGYYSGRSKGSFLFYFT